MSVLVGFILGLAVAALVTSLVTRFLRRRYLAVVEYWVYLPGAKLPPQDAVMTFLLQDRRYAKPEGIPVGPQEGLLFSDIRLHVALVLRKKNAYVFRPDLFEPHVEPSADVLAALSQAQSFVKVRFLSEQRLKTDRHLQLLPYLAEAYLELGKGLAVYDSVAERLYEPDEFRKHLAESLDATRPEFHVQIVWQPGTGSATAETRGLIKKGLLEWRTDVMDLDERVLVTGVMQIAAEKAWQDGLPEDRLRVEAFGDHFLIVPGAVRHGKLSVRLLREVSA